MIIFPCVANDTGRNIFHSVDPVQVVFRSVAPDCTTVIKCDINNQLGGWSFITCEGALM